MYKLTVSIFDLDNDALVLQSEEFFNKKENAFYAASRYNANNTNTTLTWKSHKDEEKASSEDNFSEYLFSILKITPSDENPDWKKLLP